MAVGLRQPGHRSRDQPHVVDGEAFTLEGIGQGLRDRRVVFEQQQTGAHR